MRKKIVRLVIVLIIIILIVILDINIFGSSEKYSREDIIQLLEKRDFSNIYVEMTANDSNTAIFRFKENIVIIGEGTIFSWFDFDNNERIDIDKDKNVAEITDLSNQVNSPDNIKYTIFDILITTQIKSEVFKYTYIKEEEYKGKLCIVYRSGRSKIWIDKNTGFYVKIEVPELGNKMEYDIKLNYLTDDDVKRPDLTGYEIVYE